MTDTAPTEIPSLLRALVDHRETLQRERIKWSNRVNAVANGADEVNPQDMALAQKWAEIYVKLEHAADLEIGRVVKQHPMMEQLRAVRGVGPTLGAKLLAMIDISRSETASQLWRYCGYAVIDGQRERPTKGERLHYNARLKTTLYLVATSFLRGGSPYRRVYDSAKQYYQANRPDWTPMHIHNASMRKMIKVFLVHLWERWRALEGLDCRPLYVHEKLGHTTVFTPEEFGWPEVQLW